MGTTDRGITPAIRRALLDEHATLNTARVMQTRGLVVSWDLARGGRYPLTLTEDGRRTAQALREEMDATPIMAAPSPDLMDPDESLVREHDHQPYCADHAYAYGYLATSVDLFLRGTGDAARLRADLAQTARCLLHGYDPGPDSGLHKWAGR